MMLAGSILTLNIPYMVNGGLHDSVMA